MSELFNQIGARNYKNLLADPSCADKIAVPVMPGSGEIPRGTVLYRLSNGFWAPAASGNVTTNAQLCVTDEDISAGDEVQGVAEICGAYRAGRFINGAVKLASDADLSEANKVVLRLQGIVFDNDTSAPTFNNGTYTVTYVANNGASPAEDDYVVGEAANATHTVLANSTTNFTAPSTKSFSKWNTKDDGTGTDYAAAATITMTADVTLYAVWA